jgi:integrase/recombinase XerD
MATKTVERLPIQEYDQDAYLLTAMDAFFVDRKAQGFKPKTLTWYASTLALFCRFADTQAVSRVDQITADLVRRYVLHLTGENRKPGGIHAAYRALRTFVRWWVDEMEPDGWRDPFKRAKPPKLNDEPLDPVSIADVEALLKTCGENFTGRRDAALMMFLLDTGARASEALGVDLDDVDLLTGAVLLRTTKGSKPRSVFIGKKTRKAIRAWLKLRTDGDALFTVHDGGRLTYTGLRLMLNRRSKQAGIKPAHAHGFRRAFCLAMLRQGVDLVSLSRLMGHADISLLARYAKQTNADLQAVHKKNGPVDAL